MKHVSTSLRGAGMAFGLLLLGTTITAVSHSRRDPMPASRPTSDATVTPGAIAPSALVLTRPSARVAPPARAATPVASATSLAPPSPGPSHMVVEIDPESGQLRMPEPDRSVDAGAALAARALARRPLVRHADGSASMNVRGWMVEHAVVRAGSDGRLKVECLDAPPEAPEQTPTAVPPASSTPEEE